MTLVPVLLLFAGLVLEGAYFVAYGTFNIDEGLHLNAGRLLFEQGKLPYRDFPFSQGPGGVLFYGATGWILEPSLLAGRAVSWLANAAAAAGMAWFAIRVSGRAAAALVLSLLLINFPALWSATHVRTEPLAMALSVGAAIALAFRRGSAFRWALAPSLLAWAASFRLTLLLAFVAVCVWAAFELRRTPRVLVGVVSIVVVNGLLASWPMLLFPQESLFHVVESQLLRGERMEWPSVSPWFRFWFLHSPRTGFWLLLLLLPFPLLVGRGGGARGAQPDAQDPSAVVNSLLLLAVLAYLPHLVFERGFSTYFVTSSLLLTLAIGIAVPHVARRGPGARLATWSAVVVGWMASAFLGTHHLRSWVTPHERTVVQLRKLEREVSGITPGGCRMATFQVHVAVELGCDVTPGFEYSYFSYFRRVPTAVARRWGVLNRELLAEAIRKDRPEYVALTPRDLSLITGREAGPGKAPKLPEMGSGYRLLRQFEQYVGPVYAHQEPVFLYVRADIDGAYSM